MLSNSFLLIACFQQREGKERENRLKKINFNSYSFETEEEKRVKGQKDPLVNLAHFKRKTEI